MDKRDNSSGGGAHKAVCLSFVACCIVFIVHFFL